RSRLALPRADQERPQKRGVGVLRGVACEVMKPLVVADLGGETEPDGHRQDASVDLGVQPAAATQRLEATGYIRAVGSPDSRLLQEQRQAASRVDVTTRVAERGHHH